MKTHSPNTYVIANAFQGLPAKGLAILLAFLIALTGASPAWAGRRVRPERPRPRRGQALPRIDGIQDDLHLHPEEGGPTAPGDSGETARRQIQGIYETIDVPYTIYEIFTDKKKVGYIHGVNQKGQFGGSRCSLSSPSTGR